MHDYLKLAQGTFFRTLVVAASLFLYTTPQHAEDVIPQIIGPFLGLNNTDSSIAIPMNKAQDLLNVETSPGGKSVKKRKGYGLAATLEIATSPVHGIYNFFDASGNSVDLYFNDTRMSASVGGDAPTVIFSTGSLAAIYQCVDSQGQAYCANTGRTSLIRTNGVIASPITNVNSTGTMVAVTPERLVSSGFLSAPNRIDFSKSNDFNTWVIDGTALGANQITIVSPGSRITHIVYAYGRVMWFKDSSFGYVAIDQSDLGNWQVRTVSPNIGTLDNTSVDREGLLYFRGQDGHIYVYDGSNFSKLTRDIGDTISTAQGQGIGSWTQSTQEDFNSGSFQNEMYIDTVTVSNAVSLRYGDTFSTFRNGANGKSNVWTSWVVGTSTGSVYASSDGKLIMASSGGAVGNSTNLKTSDSLGNLSPGTTIRFVINDLNGTLWFVLSPSNKSNILATDVSPPKFYMEFLGSTGLSFGSLMRVNCAGGQGNYCSGEAECGTYPMPADVQVFISTTNFAITINGDNNYFAGPHGFSAPLKWYAYYEFNNSVPSLAKLENFDVFPQTATYLSAVNFQPELTFWDSFVVTKLDNGGVHAFSMRASTNPFTVNSSTPSWTRVESGDTPSITEGTYFQVKDDFSILYSTNSPATAPSLFDFNVSWFEGLASEKSYASYFNDAIWWSVASSTSGTTTNNRILRLDLINSDWYLYDIPTNGMLVRNNDLYFGSPTEGKIFKFGDVDNDNGAAINAYWKSKDFFGDSPFVDKEIVNISMFAGSVQNSNLSVTYGLNGSSFTSYAVNLYDPLRNVVRYNKNLPLGKIGNTFNLQFGNNATDSPFEVFAVQYSIRQKTWIPTP